VKIAIVGTGYVGLVTGACFAEYGYTVSCVDRNGERIAALQGGQVPIYEPGLDDVVARNRACGRLTFTLDLPRATSTADVVFIAVGTPSRHGDGYADLSFVFAAAREIAASLQGFTVVVDKSTVPVGTARAVARAIREANPGADFAVASNPEFLREGSAIDDFMRPDRVVLGVEDERAEAVLRELYRPLYLLETPMVVTDLESAELVKYASNAFLATKVSFMNEIANLCELVGANVKHVARGMGLDKRIGPKFLHPGPGFGGSCFPKDLSALVKTYQDHGLTARIAEAVVQVNSAQKSRMIKKIREALGGSEGGKTIAVLGLAFKPETDDMREAPALTILPVLVEGGASVRAYDPKAMTEAARLIKGVTFTADAYDAVAGADAVVILTEWNEFRSLDLNRLSKTVRGRVLIDLRSIYDGDRVAECGFRYFGVGVRNREPSAGAQTPPGGRGRASRVT
jgi:UDPglucose 6-dehydrogenase